VGVFLLSRYALAFGTSRRLLWRWLLYGTAVGVLHATASLAVWAFLARFTAASGLAFAALFAAYLGVAAIQCRYWWIDLRGRCPICFERMVLPLTQGAADSILFRPAITESVCIRGHGVLAEGRWARQFRREDSPLEGLIRV
jgi:hypothetical protein